METAHPKRLESIREHGEHLELGMQKSNKARKLKPTKHEGRVGTQIPIHTTIIGIGMYLKERRFNIDLLAKGRSLIQESMSPPSAFRKMDHQIPQNHHENR